jgi:RNA polymerase sigma factor (sigma-70 family)
MTNVRIALDAGSCKIPPVVETNTMDMKPRDPRLEHRAAADAASIDWSSVLAEHERWLRTVICARVGEPQAIDEVMQEVCLAAVRQQAPITDPAKVAPWLYQLAVRNSLLYRRKQGRRRKLIDRFAQRDRPSEADNRQADPLDWLLAEERRTQVREAISRLSRRDAEILLLKYTENWSYKAMAEHLGVSPSAVETRLHRARHRLRTELAALNVTPADV